MTENILVVFALMGVGFIIKKRLIRSETLQDLVGLNLNILLPALVCTTTVSRLTLETKSQQGGLMSLLLGFPLLGMGVCLTGSLLGIIFMRFSGLKKESRDTFIYMLTFANSNVIAIPLMYLLRGEQGVFEVFLYNVGYILLQWTYGMRLLSGKPQLKYLFHPIIMGLLLGSFWGLSGFSISPPLLEALKLLGNSAMPMGLLCAGCVLAEQGLAIKEYKTPLFLLIFLKLLILPLAAYMVIRAGWIKGTFALQALMQASMPVMAQAALFTTRYGGDTQFASTGSFVTNILCLFTIPFFLGLLK